ncbi:hypothetical protein [Ruminococcus sp.]|uniref:hypothetical protein n=1 Tax=Ruminococcus sp. TaxID=41978 RepID=UPI0026138557|nr:hypothetical protein [Ruminococcus sp.]MDD6990166.1 hypothetical protein [Ruminococcus sp.]MDY6202876.1 hypothetical protein [Ruminococcus sp.]
MIYLTYDEYNSMGGICDLTAFNRNIDRACGIIDNATHNRIEGMTDVPHRAKALCRDLVEYLARYSTSDMVVSSRSQSAGGVSESESYVTKTDTELQADIDNMIADYLMAETDDNGTPLLYRGAMS